MAISHDQLRRDEANHLFAGGGEMGERMRAFNWSQTPIGPVERWPQSLKTAVRIMLTSRQPIWLGWGEQLIKLYNDPYRAIVGGKHPVALGQPASVVWREIWGEIGPMLQTAMGGIEGTYVEAQLLIMERNGYPEETYYTFSYSPIPNDEGGVGGIICANTDDTDRVVGERRLALLRELAAGTADARSFDEACALSAECLETNTHDLPFTLIYRVDPDQRRFLLAGASGVEPGHAAAPEQVAFDQGHVWPLTEAVQASGPVLISNLETSFDRLPTGPWRRPPCQAVAMPITSSGQMGKVGILVTGLNPLRPYDDRYQGFLNLVAGQVAASIANTQAYEEERKRAEALAELDRAKTAFFSNVSHEFRTPLTLMLGPLEDTLADPDGLSAENRERLEVARRNSQRLLKLVNSLLDFSRIEAGRIQSSYEPTDLASFTAELASVFRSVIERAGLRLVVDCPPLSEEVYVDREMWEKVVLNLISNAFKFTFEGEIRVELREAGAGAELTVRDTGAGIPADELPRLFERFHRVKGARGRSFEGSGIGLALVQELVRLHGGATRVESEVDRGSAFSVTIPFGVGHLPADRVQRPPNAQARDTRQLLKPHPRPAPALARGQAYVEEVSRWALQGRGEEITERRPADDAVSDRAPGAPSQRFRILLADDNADMREYVRRLLVENGYEVEAVADGLAAARAALERAPDLALTDVMMPGLDGFGLLRRLRADERTAAVPVILLSARAGEEARVEGREAGADDYLTKPFSARELLAHVGSNIALARMRREVQAEKEKSFAILENIADAFYALDSEYRFVYLNRRAEAYFGVRRETLIGRVVWEAYPMAAGTNFQTQYERAIRDQVSVNFEIHSRLLDRWVDVHASPAAGWLLVNFRDITERRLHESNLAFLAEISQDLAQLTSVDETMNALGAKIGAYLNLSLCAVIEIRESADEAVVTHDWRREDVPSVVGAYRLEDYLTADFQRAGRAGEPFIVRDVSDDLRVDRGKYAALKIGSFICVPVVSDGQWRFMLGVYDSSARDWRPDEIELIRELTQRIWLRLERARAEEALRDASRRKDEFLAMLAHELRNPLAPILNAAEALKLSGPSDAGQNWAREIIERQARHLARLVDDLLDVSRITRGKVTLVREPLDLATVVERAVETSRPLIDARKHRLSVTLPAESARVEGDLTRLVQVVGNLLNNAAKYTDEGGAIRLDVERAGNETLIRVGDNGMGMPADLLPRVFDLFTQSDRSLDRSQSGLGIGLTLVRSLVEMHGGSVEARSEGVGRGSEFIVRLPTLAPVAAPTAKGAEVAADRAGPRGLRILVVEDNADAAESMALLLRLRGHEAMIAHDGPSALAAAHSFAPQAVLCDIGLPGMNGYEVAARMRQTPGLERALLIALTGYGQEEARSRSKEAGFDHHLVKPVRPAALNKALESLQSKETVV
jgi:PAS domain S-box-containing protein